MADQQQYPGSPRGRHAQQGDARPASPQPASQHRDPPAAQRDPRQPAPRPAAPQGARSGAQQQGRRPTQDAAVQGRRPTQGAAPQGRRPAQGAAPQGRPGQGGRPQGYAPAPRQGAMVPATSRVAGGRHNPAGDFGKKKKSPWRIVFWIALVVLVVSLAALGAIAFSYWQGQSAYDSLAEEVFTPPADIEGASLADLTVDWDKLKAKNPDTVGWVYIPGTTVNYPIVHTTDDEKYLTTDFDGKQTWGATYGTIFLSAANAADFSDANSIIYGHHLNNGSMFADIAGFEDAAKFNASRTVYLLTPQGNYKLKTFSLVHVAADDPLAQTAFASNEELASYVQDKVDRSVAVASDIPAVADLNRIFSFATCDNLPSDGRFVLFSYIAESTVAGVVPVGAAAAPEADTVDPAAAEAVGDSAKETAA
ncbi:MAG: sortase [Gordonibacter sp.]|uniref:class B sortase n=1 Tax=Gordonibacter sp. TaxID=1968902 RepID=UPI002FC92F65